MKSDLKDTQYLAAASDNWLEHYNAACHYALAIVDDQTEKPAHKEYAFEAVAALDRAASCGEAIGFVTSKRYWLQAGDPDFAGLRCYTCFRAFEARIYSYPLPATTEISKYELYLYLRTVLQQAAGYLENAWRSRARLNLRLVTHAEFEEWWRLEQQAWELAIRLGRFYRQWQTRQAAVEALRNWLESFGPEFRPIAYPNLLHTGYTPHGSDYVLTEKLLADTEKIFNFLGTKCGSLVASTEAADSSTIFANTNRWTEYAASRSRADRHPAIPEYEIVAACLARSAVWAALRQWAQLPGDQQETTFHNTMTMLPRDPEAAL